MARRRRIQGFAAALGAAVVAGCGVFGPTTPRQVARSLDEWRDLGLACSGPVRDSEPSGLVQWSCQGRVAGTLVEATIDGNDTRFVDLFATVPAASPRAVAVAALAAIVDGTDALTDVRASIRPWLLAWHGVDASAGFGSTTVRLQVDETWYSLGVTVNPPGS